MSEKNFSVGQIVKIKHNNAIEDNWKIFLIDKDTQTATVVREVTQGSDILNRKVSLQELAELN
jgi:hypothetical protein